jgi:predicted DNA-binding transcriptional regulator YafY
VMNFGEDVKIISPQHVKEEFVKSLSQTLAQYKE